MNKDLTNVIGSFIETELDYIEKSNNEIEKLLQEKQQLKEENEKLKKIIKVYENPNDITGMFENCDELKVIFK